MTDQSTPAFPTDRLGDVTSIAPISLGLSGAATYAVTTARGDYVLRSHGSDPDTWDRLVAMQTLAASHGVAPALVHVDTAAHTTVSVRIAGAPFGGALADANARPVAIRSLVQQLATLHAIPVRGVPALDPIPLAHAVWSSQVGREGFPSWAMPFGDRIPEFEAILREDDRRVFSHGDLNPANILWDGARVWLVDWERAGPAHPYLDLATLATFMDLPDDSALGLVGAQEGAPLTESQQRVFHGVRAMARLIYGAIFLQMVPDLRDMDITNRAEVPSLGACFQRVAAGELALQSARGQALVGAAILAQMA